MSNSNGWKTLIVVLFVAIIMGGVGFGAGYIVHSLLSGTPLLAALNFTATSTAQPQWAVPAATLSPTETPLPPTPTPAVPGPGASPQPSATPLASETGGTTAKSQLEEEFGLFWQVWGLVEDEFYGDLPENEEVVYGAIRGALETLGDPFTGFLEPDAAAASRRSISGSYEGIGAFVTMGERGLMIVSPIRGSPAEAAGLRKGDVILQADDTPLQNMSVYEAISYVVGPAGTQVRLRIAREGVEPFEVTITRARIEVPVVESEMRADGVAYVRYNEFSDGASEQLGDAIEKLLALNPKGVILDLRGNPGGLLNEAILTAGLFLPRDSVVLIERSRDGSERPYRTPYEPRLPEIALVVLVDGSSASASEIVAAALQDTGRATLVGETTFGKGAVQYPHDLEDGSQVRITVSRFFSPMGHEIHGVGVSPDIEVEITDEDAKAGRDPQLARAVQFLLTGQ